MARRKFYLLNEVSVKFVFLGSVVGREWFSSTQNLEHVPPELLLHRPLLPEGVQHQLAEVREVDEAVLGDPVGDVHHLLVGGVQPKSLHRLVKILRVDGGSSQPGLQGPEHRGHVLQLLVGQHVGVVGDVVGDPNLGCGDNILQ